MTIMSCHDSEPYWTYAPSGRYTHQTGTNHLARYWRDCLPAFEVLGAGRNEDVEDDDAALSRNFPSIEKHRPSTTLMFCLVDEMI